MANRLQKTLSVIYTPAVRPVAAVPAYCVTTGGQHSSNMAGVTPLSSSVGTVDGVISGIQTTAAIQPVLGEGALPWSVEYGSGWILDGANLPPTGLSGGYSPYVERLIPPSTVCYPAVEAVPGEAARVDYSQIAGWDSGARSIDQIPDDGAFRCRLPNSVAGVQIGFCGRTLSHYYGDMSHSLVARRSFYSIVEAGFSVFGPSPLPADAQIKLRRLGGIVTYWVNDELVYQSVVPSQGEAFGAVLLYGPDDFVDNPKIEVVASTHVLHLSLPRLVMRTANNINTVDSLIPPLQLTAKLDSMPGVNRFFATLPAMVAAISSGAEYNTLQAKLPAYVLTARLDPVEELITSFAVALPPPVLSALGQVGVDIEFRATLPPLVFAAADIQSYNRVQARLPISLSMMALEPYLPSDWMDGSDALVAFDQHVLETVLLLVSIDSLDVSNSAQLTLILELASNDELQLTDVSTFGSIIEMIAMERMSVSGSGMAAQSVLPVRSQGVRIVSSVPDLRSAMQQQALQYAVNYMTGALTTYHDFDFIGFTHDAGQAFAWRADGLYKLGDSDAGEVVQALVDFGATDYGDANLNRVQAAFVGVRTDGNCYLRLTTDSGPERVYQLVGSGGQRRATLSKGVAGHYWNACLELTDTSYATLDSLEMEVGVSQRRWQH